MDESVSVLWVSEWALVEGASRFRSEKSVKVQKGHLWWEDTDACFSWPVEIGRQIRAWHTFLDEPREWDVFHLKNTWRSAGHPTPGSAPKGREDRIARWCLHARIHSVLLTAAKIDKQPKCPTVGDADVVLLYQGLSLSREEGGNPAICVNTDALLMSLLVSFISIRMNFF